jgi:hypothetical protein
MIDTAVVLVNLSVPPQVGDDREVPAAAINFTREGCCNVSDAKYGVRGITYASRRYGCTCVFVANLVV